jgi:hypothetical protein
MAQETKSTNSRKSSAGARARNSPRPSASARSGKGASPNGRAAQTRARSRSAGARRKSTSSRSANRSSSSSKKQSTAAKAKEATSKSAHSAGDAIGATARKLKTPAIAAGAGLAGLAGGIALTRGRKKKVLGVPLPGRTTTKNLTGAAKNFGALAERTGHVAEQVRVVSEALGNNDNRRRSPVEVLLEGLTRRSQAARHD